MRLGDPFRVGIATVFLGAAMCQGQTGSPTLNPDSASTIASSTPPLTALAPLTMGARAKYALNRSFGPASIGLGVVTSGLQTWRGRPEAWGRDWEGFAQRFGMRMSRSAVGNGIDFGVGAALGTDPRYRPLGHGTFGARFKYALGASFYHYDSHGNRVPAISRFAGIAGANILTNHWSAPGDDRKIDVVWRSGQQLGWQVGWTLLREFIPDIRRKLGK